MKPLFFLFFLQIAVLFWGCKKDREIVPEVIEVRDEYLKSIRVNGAREATLDTTLGYIQVVLPADYNSDVLDLALELGDGMKLGTPPDSTLFVENHVRYRFMGVPPVVFGVGRTGNGGHEKFYTVFVKHEGELTAKLTSRLIIASDQATYSDTSDLHVYGYFRAVSGLGSIPETPDGIKIISFELKDIATGQRATGGNRDVYPFEFIVAPVSKLLTSTRMQLTMRYGEKEFQFPEVNGLDRPGGWGRVFWYDKQWKNLIYSKPVTILGGVFLPDYQYKVTISNDRMTTPRKINASIKSYNQLFFNIPDDVPEDQYVVNVYEEDKLIGISTEAISRDSLKMSVARIWTERDECPVSMIIHGNVQKTSLKKGQTFYAMPFPGIAEYQHGKPIDPGKPLPSLQLKSGSTSILLKATAQADWCYGDGSIYIYYGVYTLPADVASGLYEARFISDKETSLPYWSLVDIH